MQMLLDRGVAGIIYVSGQHADTTTDPRRYVHLRDRGLPIVLVNGFMPGIDAPFVSNDDEAVHGAVAEPSDPLGTQSDRPGRRARRATSRRSARWRATGGSCPPCSAEDVEDMIATEIYTVEGGQAAASRLIETGCTALVCGSDLMALGAVRGVRALGMRVPEDISVIGYDDSTLIAFTDPPLTTVRQRVLAMGETTVQALVDEISGIQASRTEYVFRPELVVRGPPAPSAVALADVR